jgi:hypothetical protein
MTETSLATSPSNLLALLTDVKGDTCPERIIKMLTVATREKKLVWVRDAAWQAICLVPFQTGLDEWLPAVFSNMGTVMVIGDVDYYDGDDITTWGPKIEPPEETS